MQIALGVEARVEFRTGEGAEFGRSTGKNDGVVLKRDAAIREIAGNALLQGGLFGIVPGGKERVDLVFVKCDGSGANGRLAGFGLAVDAADLLRWALAAQLNRSSNFWSACWRHPWSAVSWRPADDTNWGCRGRDTRRIPTCRAGPAMRRR